MLEQLVARAPVFLLVYARVMALILTLPLFSTQTIRFMAKVALGFFMAYLIYPQVSLATGTYAAYASFITVNGEFNLVYVLLLLGEAFIGIIIGFYIQIIFAAFSTAGQFFAFQMGFTAAEAYDSLNQVENPLMGQFLNLIAMLVFLQNHWFQTLFMKGMVVSFQSMNCFAIAEHSDILVRFMLGSLTRLFYDALIIALPLMGTLFLINITMGLLSKAAPQMNLLSEGFPILMLTAFFVIAILLPYLVDFFIKSFADGFAQVELLFKNLGGQIQ